jgi:hypothetical protein
VKKKAFGSILAAPPYSSLVYLDPETMEVVQRRGPTRTACSACRDEVELPVYVPEGYLMRTLCSDCAGGNG